MTPVGRFMVAQSVSGGWLLWDKHHHILARIEWYAPWKEYVARMVYQTQMSQDCCYSLSKFLKTQNDLRKAACL